MYPHYENNENIILKHFILTQKYAKLANRLTILNLDFEHFSFTAG